MNEQFALQPFVFRMGPMAPLASRSSTEESVATVVFLSVSFFFMILSFRPTSGAAERGAKGKRARHGPEPEVYFKATRCVEPPTNCREMYNSEGSCRRDGVRTNYENLQTA